MTKASLVLQRTRVISFSNPGDIYRKTSKGDLISLGLNLDANPDDEGLKILPSFRSAKRDRRLYSDRLVPNE